MRIALGGGEIALGAGQPLAIRDAHGARLECTQGAVWVTMAGMPDDIILVSGASIRLEGRGLVLVEGSPSGCVRLRPATRVAKRETSISSRHVDESDRCSSEVAVAV